MLLAGSAYYPPHAGRPRLAVNISFRWLPASCLRPRGTVCSLQCWLCLQEKVQLSIGTAAMGCLSFNSKI